MSYSIALKTALSAAALSAIAGTASAATTQFGTFESDGTFDYLGVNTQGGIAVTVDFDSTSADGGLVTGGAFNDTSIARDYSLNYTFGVDFGSTTLSNSGSKSLGNFSLDSLVASLASQPTSGSFELFPGATAQYSNLSFPTSSTITFDYSVNTDPQGSQAILDFFGFDGNMVGPDRGTYNLNAELVADVADVAPVPLPAALPLLLAGLGGLAAVGRRRRKAA
jgi:hypothetical protein